MGATRFARPRGKIVSLNGGSPANGRAFLLHARVSIEREEAPTGGRGFFGSFEGIAKIVSAIEEGDYSRALGDRLADLEKQQELLEARLSEAPPSTVRLHPRLAEVYAEKVRQLEQALNDPVIRAEAADVLRFVD